MIDWAKIRTLSDLSTVPEEELYDNSPDLPNDYQLMPGLTAEEIEDAMFWKDYLRGIMLVTGMPGMGKGMFAHMLAFKLKRYFGLTVVSDTKPRPLFGRYVPFSEPFLVDQLDRMWEVTTGEIPTGKYIEDRAVNYRRQGFTPKEAFEKAREEEDVIPHENPHVASDGRWISSRGEVFIKRAVWLLDEFGSKYMNRREPNAPLHRTLLFKVFPIWRHLESVIIGMATEMDDLDPRCQPKLTTEVRCNRMLVVNDPSYLYFKMKLYPLRFISSMGELEYQGGAKIIELDGQKPRDCLGGKAWKDIYNTKQAIGIEAPRSMRNRSY